MNDMSESERKYTSTISKLVNQTDRFGEWKQGIYKPISLQVAPTDICNLSCDFCSVANRSGDVLPYYRLTATMQHLAKRGLKTVEFTGGGDPTMYERLPDAIQYAHRLGLDIGLITNGIALKSVLDGEHLDMLDWVRISMNCLDYVSDVEIPELPRKEKNTVLGFSYVVGERASAVTIEQIFRKMDAHDVTYLRVVPNCLSTETIAQSKETARDLGLTVHPRAFFQEKEYHVPSDCRIGYLKPFLNADGYFYHCSANPLIERRFHPDFRMGEWNEVARIWGDEQKPFCTDGCHEGKCFFSEHNDFLKALTLEIEHKDFI